MISKLNTAPTKTPVSLSEVKEDLRIGLSDTSHDFLLIRLLSSAVNRVESETGRALISQTWDLVFDSWTDLIWKDRHAGILRVLPFGVVSSVGSISYLDEDETTQSVSSDEFEISGLGTDECRIVFHSDGDFDYPGLYEVDPITVRIVCGYGTESSDVPDEIRTAIMIIVSDLFDGEDHDKTINALIKSYRLLSF